MSAAVVPEVQVEVGGVPLAGGDARALGEVRVHQALSLPTVCELTFFDPEGAVVGADAAAPGASLRVRVTGFPAPLFEGEVTATAHEYGPSGARRVHVRGYDLLHRLRKRQPVRSHIQVDIEELARSLTADLGVPVAAGEPGPLREQLFQHGQSDLDLLAEAAGRCGCYFILRDGVLRLTTLAGFGPALSLAWGVGLIEASVEINAEGVCRSVEARAWDPQRTAPLIGSATQARGGRDLPAGEGGALRRILVDAPARDDAQAEGVAQAELDRCAAREVVLRAVAEGDPALGPGTRVEITGTAPPLAGRYVLTAVRHVIDRRQGFVSELETAPPPAREGPRRSAATLGIVSRVDDPEGMGRVRVVLPSYNEVEAGWLPVVTPGAGPGKGIVALPDIDDRVLVVLLDGDPARGVVLGGLYGMSPPPDPGVEGGAVRRYTLATPGGLRVRLDDAAGTVAVENGAGDRIDLSPEAILVADSRGSRIELGADRCRILSSADLEIAAPGRRVTIGGQAIDFERV